MNTCVSVRVKSLKHGSSQLRHDFRIARNISHVDYSRSKNNVVLINEVTTVQDMRKKELEQIKRFETAKKHKIMHNANLAVSGIITFGGEDYLNKALNSLDELDKKAKEYVEKIANKYDVEALYLVRHADEASPHYQFMLSNVKNDLSRSQTTMTTELDRTATSQLQDIAGEVFHDAGFDRGKKKIDRLRDGEPFANTVHKTVQEMHARLIPNLEKLKAELKSSNEELEK